MKTNNFHKNKIRTITAIIISIVIAVGLFLPFDNFSLDVEKIDVKVEKNISGLVGFKIAQISDFHNRRSNIVTDSIIKNLKEEKPNLIAVTGDLVDCSHTDVEISINFLNRLVQIAPTYVIYGNHEANINNNNKTDFETLNKKILKTGAIVLRNSRAVIELENGNKFNLYGIDDPYFYVSSLDISEKTAEMCTKLNINKNEFNVLLAHHPEELPNYSSFGFDVVYSGHAHGGQVTFFGKGIVAPDQGLFPKYTSGLYKMKKTSLVLSRGIGYSIIPFRMFCRPHLIITEFN